MSVSVSPVAGGKIHVSIGSTTSLNSTTYLKCPPGTTTLISSPGRRMPSWRKDVSRCATSATFPVCVHLVMGLQNIQVEGRYQRTDSIPHDLYPDTQQ